MTPNKQALREVAEKALQGEWDWEDGAIWNTNESGWVKHMATVDAGDEVSDEEHKNNMLFITAATPAVVLALLDEHSELETRVANDELRMKSRLLENADRDISALRLRVAELEAREVILPVTIEAHPFRPQLTKMLLELHRNTVNECANAIRAAGIKIKGE